MDIWVIEWTTPNGFEGRMFTQAVNSVMAYEQFDEFRQNWEDPRIASADVRRATAEEIAEYEKEIA